MWFWIIIAGLAVCVAVVLTQAMRRGAQTGAVPAEYDLKVYRDQLAEVDRDVVRGVLEREDAERVRTEISRRILAADASARQQGALGASKRANIFVIAGMAIVLIAGSGGIYASLGAPGYGDLALQDRIEAAERLRAERPSQKVAEAGLARQAIPRADPNANEDYEALVAQLREVVAERPDDPEGLRLLAVSERNLGNFTEARAAFERYLALRGEAATTTEFADHADLMIMAAGGYVSPEAEAALTRALELDGSNAPALYYWGLMRAQTGRPDQAFRIWDELLRAGPPEAPWIGPIQAQIEEMALRAGVNYTMPEPGTGLRGPSAADIDAAGDMTAGERLEMIEGMVATLGERLGSEGGTAEEWGQLITALSVLGRSGQAAAIYEEAQTKFAGNPTALDRLFRAAERAGVAN